MKPADFWQVNANVLMVTALFMMVFLLTYMAFYRKSASR
jgi:hypothetical protein